MSYQKQKGSYIYNESNTDSDLNHLTLNKSCKNKRIQKIGKNREEEISEMYCTLSKNKKQMAKQIKRIREQKRRANHKEFVTTLQQQIKNKEIQIQRLCVRIKQLEHQLQQNICHKCGNSMTQVSFSPVSLPQQMTPDSDIQQQKQSLDLDGSFRRITDQSSLKLCFGNKSFLFFLVTMCCLTIGSIADNPEIFMEPIQPYAYRTQLSHLSQSHKIKEYLTSKQQQIKAKNSLNFQINNIHQSEPPRTERQISRVSSLLNFRIMLGKFMPNFSSFLPSMKDPTQLFLSFGTNNLFRRILDGRHYYR